MFCGSLNGILEEFEVDKITKRMKAADKARSGEVIVDTARFMAPALKKPKREEKKEEMPEDIENRRVLEAGLMRAQDIQRQKREQLEATKRIMPNPPRNLKRMAPSLASASTASSQDELLNSLKVAASDRFVKKAGPCPSNSVSHNAPEGLTCLVCDSAIKKVSGVPYSTPAGTHVFSPSQMAFTMMYLTLF